MFEYYGGVPSRHRARLLEDRRRQMPSVRSRSERRLRVLGRALLHRDRSGACEKAEG